MASKILSIFNVDDASRKNPPKTLKSLKTVQEWISSAIESVKEIEQFPDWLEKLSPWASAGYEAAKESLPVVKFVLKLFEELTKSRPCLIRPARGGPTA
jgi:hypothetical protein